MGVYCQAKELKILMDLSLKQPVKFTRVSKLTRWLRSYVLMPTLETHEVLTRMKWKSCVIFYRLIKSVLASFLRIGGNDLLNLLSLRRSCNRTIYDSPLREIISILVRTFKPYGFNLTARFWRFPILTCFAQSRTRSYIRTLYAAIHPEQVPVIESAYAVKEEELKWHSNCLVTMHRHCSEWTILCASLRLIADGLVQGLNFTAL